MMTMARTESSYGAEKLGPRLETRIYATEIGIRRSFSNTNYHELFINFSDSRLYDELHGNYMFYLNTNYHELFINYRRQQII
jgi:hypothetical protein